MDETSISRKLDLSEAKAKYDEYAKSLLSEKIILAHILARCVSEYKGMKPEDIVPLIEGQPEISTVHLYPGETNKRTQNPEITGMNTEDSVPNEKKVVYDIHFRCRSTEKIPHRTRFCDKGVLLYFPHDIRTAWKRV